MSIKLPAPLGEYANARHGRYVLTARVSFPHRGVEWRDRIVGDRAVAYRIHLDVDRGRWYLDAAWTRPVVPTIPLDTARVHGMVGVDTNADHFAAYRLDRTATRWASRTASATTCPGLLITGTRRSGTPSPACCAGQRVLVSRRSVSRTWTSPDENTREKHGRKKKLRQLISGIPTGKLTARLVSMAAGHGLAIVPTPNTHPARHDAASIAIGRRALGHPIRRRTAPPPQHRGDEAGHRTAQARPGDRGRDGSRLPTTDRAPRGPTPSGTRKRDRMHPTPFGMRPVGNSRSMTHLCTLVRNGRPAGRQQSPRGLGYAGDPRIADRCTPVATPTARRKRSCSGRASTGLGSCAARTAPGCCSGSSHRWRGWWRYRSTCCAGTPIRATRPALQRP